MSDFEDEFDKHNAIPFDVEHLPYITDLPPSPVASLSRRPQQNTISTTHVDIEVDIDPILTADPQYSPKSDYSAYDLSEFTTDELQALEAAALQSADISADSRPEGTTARGWSRQSPSLSTGGRSRTPREESEVATQLETEDNKEEGEEGERDAAFGSGSNGQSSTHRTCSTLPNTLSNGGPAIDIELEQSTPSLGLGSSEGPPSCLRARRIKPNRSDKGKMAEWVKERRASDESEKNPLLAELNQVMQIAKQWEMEERRKSSSSLLGTDAVRRGKGQRISAKGKGKAVEEIEEASAVQDVHTVELKEPSADSWRARMKKGAWFRATDFTSPLWCEYQFEYRHLQRVTDEQDRKANRISKNEIVTTTGKTVKVDRKLDEKVIEVQKAGTSMHRVLERMVHPEEEKPVKVVTEEDIWGHTMVKMINSVQSLVQNGVCREMFVFGFIYGAPIRGVIDEVTREPLALPVPPRSPKERKRRREETSLPTTPTKPQKPPKFTKNQSPSQTHISSYFSSSSSTSTSFLMPHIPEPTYRLKISDTKTRRYPWMPPEEDYAGGRLQLMIYHRLLSSLIAPPGSPHATDFAKVFEKAGLSSTKEFSPSFHEDSELPEEVKCLDDLVKMWYNTTEMLSAREVSPELCIDWRVLEKSNVEENATEDMEASSASVTTPGVAETTTNGVSAGGSEKKNHGKDKERDVESSSDSEEALEQYKSVMFAQSVFEYDDKALGDQVCDMLRLWNGERKPKGVDITLTRRCDSCVYKMGCEWREQKAAEAIEKAAKILVNEDPFVNSVPGLDMSTYAGQSARRSS